MLSDLYSLVSVKCTIPATEILMASKDYDLAAQTNYELGCLYYHNSDTKFVLLFYVT